MTDGGLSLLLFLVWSYLYETRTYTPWLWCRTMTGDYYVDSCKLYCKYLTIGPSQALPLALPPRNTFYVLIKSVASIQEHIVDCPVLRWRPPYGRSRQRREHDAMLCVVLTLRPDIRVAVKTIGRSPAEGRITSCKEAWLGRTRHK